MLGRMPPKARTEIAYQGALHRTIPKKFVDVTIGATNGTYDLSALGGKWVYLRALTANVSIKLGASGSMANVNEGYPVLTTDPRPEEFFIDPGDEVTLNHIALSAATLRIFSD